MAHVLRKGKSQFLSGCPARGNSEGTNMIAEKTENLSYASGDVEELAFLLPSWQVTALAEVAESQGLTVAQFMRRLVNQALA
jgi:hypothetical protein